MRTIGVLARKRGAKINNISYKYVKALIWNDKVVYIYIRKIKRKNIKKKYIKL